MLLQKQNKALIGFCAYDTGSKFKIDKLHELNTRAQIIVIIGVQFKHCTLQS